MIATQAKLLAFLKKSSQFVIPIYQRTYSWKEKECRQLWDDIIRTGSNESISMHFVGSIVYIEEGLSQLPSLADAQREAMVAVARQVETSRESTERVADALDVCQQSMAQLGDATMATERAATQLSRDTSARDERLASILQEQTRRLTLFAYVALTLAVVAVVVGVVALTR